MLGSLFIKECRQTARSLIYWIVAAVLAMFFFSQMGELDVAEKPKPGQDNYGITYSDDTSIMMENTLGELAEEYYYGKYITYPIGFYKTVKLSDAENKRIGEILEETAGITDMTIVEKKMEEHYNTGEIVMTGIKIEPLESLSFERFEKLMDEADKLLGGGSSYGEEFRKSNAVVPKTYKDAVKEYEVLIEKDRLTGGYARLFCDYMGIILAIAPVFLAVTRGLRDRRSMMQELIGSRKASSAAIIVSRYAAMVCMTMIPVVILSFFPLAECMKFASSAGIAIDYLAFIKYSFGWLLPTVMASLAVGLVLTEFTDTAVAVLIQGVWWFVAVFSGASSMQGGMYGWNLIPRHNTIHGYDRFKESFFELAANRALYAGLGLALMVLTIWIFEQKRKGKLDIYGKIHANRKSKSKA